MFLLFKSVFDNDYKKMFLSFFLSIKKIKNIL